MLPSEPIRRLLGRAPYVQTWHAMRDFTVQRGPETADELWLVEHEPVYTLGQAGRREHLIAPGATPVVATDRGGQVTYHGPGQAIVYTLIDLRRLGITVRELVFRIEQAVIQTLEPYGVGGRRVRGAPRGLVALPGRRPPRAHKPGRHRAPRPVRWAGQDRGPGRADPQRVQLPRCRAECRDGSETVFRHRSLRLCRSCSRRLGYTGGESSLD